MDDDFNATPIAKLPPPSIQTRRAEPPPNAALPPPVSVGRRDNDLVIPDYGELMKNVNDPVAQYDDDDYNAEYNADYSTNDNDNNDYEQPPQHYYQPPSELPLMSQHTLPPPPQQPQPALASPPSPPPQAQPDHTVFGVMMKHKYAIVVAVLVMLMLMYGMPKISTIMPVLLTSHAEYQLSTPGKAIVAGLVGCTFGIVSSHI